MSRSSSEAFEALKTFLVQNYQAKVAAGGREIVKRCHLCGDSKDPSSRHMYIGLRDGLIVYNCFKCNASGVVDSKFFRDLGCFDINMINMCNQNNSQVSSSTNSRKTSFRKRGNLSLPITEDSRTLQKVDYINLRLGTDLNLIDLNNLKIVPNLYQFLNANGTPPLTRTKMVCDQLDAGFLGFLSVDNAYLIMRRLVDQNQVLDALKERYVNYNIYNMISNSYRYYILPGWVVSNDTIRLNIAEGPFDILGVRFNTDAARAPNSIFAAVGGKSYVSLVRFFIMEYGFINLEIHVYADNDVDNYEFEKIKNLVAPYGNKVFLHRNTYPGEKDYGVRKEHITDSVIRLL